VRPFIDAVEHFFRAMLGHSVTAGEPVVTIAPRPERDVRATVGLSGTPPGTFTLVMSEPVAVKTVSAFARRSISLGSGDFRDAMGEIANIIAGHAAPRVPGRRFAVCCPSVSMTDSANPPASAKASPKAADAIVFSVPFTAASGPFLIEVELMGIEGAGASAQAA